MLDDETWIRAMGRVPAAIRIGVSLASALALTAWASTPPLEQNCEVARLMLEERLGEGRIEELSHLVAPDFAARSATKPDRVGNLEQDIAAIRGWRSAAPDLEVKLLRSVAEGEWVATLWRATATNTGEGDGLPATGRKLGLVP
jgi:hypothetical protein